jgi:hypothetical protein
MSAFKISLRLNPIWSTQTTVDMDIYLPDVGLVYPRQQLVAPHQLHIPPLLSLQYAHTTLLLNLLDHLLHLLD